MLVVKWSQLVVKFFTITATDAVVRKRDETNRSQLMSSIVGTSSRTLGHREKLQEYKTEIYGNKTTNLRLSSTYKRNPNTPKCSLSTPLSLNL